MTGTDDGVEVVHIAIPARYVEPVVNLLAELQRGDKGSGRPPKSLHGDLPELAGQWSLEDLRRLAAGTTRTQATIQVILDVLAEQPGERLSAARVVAATGLPADRLRGAFAGLKRLLKARSMNSLGLPLNRHNVKSGSDETTYYWLTEEQADQWKRVRAGDGGRGNG